jgi:23S rRNA (cytidine2498-2'-O)-methyltransferase
VDDHSQFLFASCQRGAEPALKWEVAARQPEFRLAFSRPGFVTFKCPTGTQAEQFLNERWVFARTWGVSLGNVAGQRLHALADRMWQLPPVVQQIASRRIHDLHVWQCDTGLPGRHGFEPGPTPLSQQIEHAVREAAPAAATLRSRKPNRPSTRNTHVLDVVIVAPNEWWIGWHRVNTPQQQWPGGVMPLELPTEAASRAYLKIEEALRWSSFPIAEGDEWVEIGCAPGGASKALLDRGQFVTGIDPADVDPQLLKHERFRHLKMRSADVRRHEFRDVNWLAADMNVAPQYTLDAVEAIVTHPGVNIRGMVLTLKLADWKLAQCLDEYLSRIRGWGYRDVRARQLAYHGREVAVVALRRRALRRFAGKTRRRRSAGSRTERT